MPERPDPRAAEQAAAAASAQEQGRAVFAHTAAALEAVAARLDARFDQAVELLAACEGRVVFTGLGKSGHVARKLASTFSSTGTPATFLHATEATHGDLGFVRGEDLCVILSKSGDGEELRRWIPFLRERRCRVLALAANPRSYLARAADLVLDCAVSEEACPHNLAPTTSSTVALVMGDALAIALLQRRGFSPEDFRRFHPGGVLGRRLTLRVADLMHQGEALPWVKPEASLREALLSIMRGGLGLTVLLDAPGGVARGLLTDGDLKRILVAGAPAELLDRPVRELASADPRRVAPELLAVEALERMEHNQPGPITSLLVTDAEDRVLGVLHLHDILRAGLGEAEADR